MNTLPIIVPGKGRIPRLGSIGPKLNPFEVPIEVIEAIVKAPHSPGATFINPINNEKVVLTRSNYRSIFDKFSVDPQESSSPMVRHIIDDYVEPAVKVETTEVTDDKPTDRTNEVAKVEDQTERKPIAEAEAVPEPAVEPETKPARAEPPATETEADRKVDQPQGFKRITKPDDNRSGKNRDKKH